MKKPILRAMLILACIALIVTAGAWHACASFLDVFPSDMFGGDRAQVRQAGNSHYNFFNMALGMVPSSDDASKQQVSGLLNMKNSYDGSSIPLPSTSFQTDWMSPLMAFGASTDGSNSTAGSAYNQLIKRFDNQSNIYAY